MIVSGDCGDGTPPSQAGKIMMILPVPLTESGGTLAAAALRLMIMILWLRPGRTGPGHCGPGGSESPRRPGVRVAGTALWPAAGLRVLSGLDTTEVAAAVRPGVAGPCGPQAQAALRLPPGSVTVTVTVARVGGPRPPDAAAATRRRRRHRR